MMSVGTRFRRLTSEARPAARLLCFPYAGAGANVFNGWSRWMPSGVELVAATYPGRESRAGEPALHCLAEVVEDLGRAIKDYLDLPYVFFGHSMGALVAYELARRLGEHRLPEHVFVSGARAPHCPRAEELHALPPPDFLRSLIRLGGFPPEALAEPELIAYALPILRADFTACETHIPDLGTCVRFPLTAMGGIDDPRVDAGHVEAWRAVSSVGFASRMYSGGHFFLRDHGMDVATQVLAPLSGGPGRKVLRA